MEFYVSSELDCEKMILSMYSSDFVGRIQIFKSEYKNARTDFLVLNKENLKSFVVETKDWLKKEPTFISVSKIINCKKHYSGNGILILSHKQKYYWLDILKIDWENVKTIKIPNKNDADYDLCYDIEILLSTNMEELSNVLLLRLLT
tara:strand:+ start:236 stop:676 length:441 start_codon:yes stop_codon:yes gene_type:complete